VGGHEEERRVKSRKQRVKSGFLSKVYHTNIASGTESKETFIKIVTYKHGMLKTSQYIFFVSFIFLLIAMGLYLW
jgi:hypothetical protein